jgi:DNA-binding response OmpR family regulator
MPASIVIAEDDPSIILSLQFLLEKAGYAVRVAKDGEAALRQIKEAPPDLVLLDVMMPRLGGYDVCQAIRADPALARVKVVMLTAKGRDIERAKGLALGADDYMVKPFSTRALLRRVADFLAVPRR